MEEKLTAFECASFVWIYTVITLNFVCDGWTILGTIQAFYEVMTGTALNCHELVSLTNIMTSFLRDSMVAAVIVVLYYKLTKNRLNMQVQ